jgi:hypothetical protein
MSSFFFVRKGSMAKHVFEQVTDAKVAAEKIYKYIRKQRVEHPEDLADLLSEVAAELMCSVDSCHRADFLIREKDDKRGATTAMQEVMDAINTFKNQLGYLVSQADYCLHGVTGRRVRSDGYSHRPDNRLPLLKPATIAAGLEGVKSDFKEWRMERRTEGWVLVVETHPIRISDPRYDVIVDFGPFNIELQLSQLARGVHKPYKLVAIHPNIVAGHPRTTHPHVKNDLLCEGAGEGMIRKALRVGDLQSFLIIISQILTTYNPGSPYLRLEYWSKLLPRGANPRPHASFGEDESDEPVCQLCENEIEEPFNCSLCGRIICEECSHYCDDHDRTICTTCMNTMRSEHRGCADCEDFGSDICRVEVQRSCADCGRIFAMSTMHGCVARATWLCHNCFDSRVRDRRPCCEQWESSNCPLASRMPRTETGFAAPENNPALHEAQVILDRLQGRPPNNRGEDIVPPPPPAPFPRRQQRDGFIDTAPDDGVGGFGPPQAAVANANPANASPRNG